MDRTVLITGASRGIGAAVARAFAAQGDRVAVCYRTGELQANVLTDALHTKGMQAAPFFVDVTDARSVQNLFDAVQATWGGVDVLVNNAGIAQQTLLQDMTPGAWDDMMDTHAKGTFLCCRAALPDMIRRKSGCILNVSSMWGQVGASCEVAYSAAKAAVIGLTKALAKEVGPSGIRVNCIAPGAVETDMLAGFSAQDKAALAEETPLCRLGTPQDIAAAAVFLASANASFITGQVLGVNGGLVIV